ncbi:uncharacterized protein STEHIDRAFT_109437 [Stereum hirsutum FP-91666 SS1]|uniref:uncharacterized protein n=1 Tax=Stereum hirsutum (strain FP-91666) TaxID=721885 RepID=UPI000440C756|nr:uncharacterized protein STEHIDRAFT_109437 [Stereum hirsutum FP-91666 SS1]EIM89190.1 hypothetical protein STEHIDRAFT_109437 [Stereum hirsutum FP-91666 SS1]
MPDQPARLCGLPAPAITKTIPTVQRPTFTQCSPKALRVSNKALAHPDSALDSVNRSDVMHGKGWEGLAWSDSTRGLDILCSGSEIDETQCWRRTELWTPGSPKVRGAQTPRVKVTSSLNNLLGLESPESSNTRLEALKRLISSDLVKSSKTAQQEAWNHQLGIFWAL